MKYLIMGLLLSACGKDHTPTLQIKGFESQVAEFETVGATYGHHLQINDLIIELHDSLPSANENGVCYLSVDQTPVIWIQTEYWNNADDTLKQQLLFHELGHCILHRQAHNNGIGTNGMPSSIMNACSCTFYSFSVQGYFETNTNSYYQELFNPEGL